MTNITAERANKLNDAHKEIAHVADKVKRLEKLNDELEIENNDLTAKTEETKKENAKLSADLKELQSKPATNGAGTAVSILTEELEATKKELVQSKASVDEWVVLAKVSPAR
jgi:predicted RNase H-like nuclease (RuvC/YqgF family)